MAHVIASRRLRFVDAEGEHEVIPGEAAQPFPDRFLTHHYFQAAAVSGWIRSVDLVREPVLEHPLELLEPVPRKKRNVLP
jgi:hypothetical protein